MDLNTALMISGSICTTMPQSSLHLLVVCIQDNKTEGDNDPYGIFFFLLYLYCASLYMYFFAMQRNIGSIRNVQTVGR